MNGFNYVIGYTHGGKFHADDVFSTALLMILNPKITIIRGFKPPMDDSSTIVYDIGLGEFDHHQIDGEIRECGIKYAAFGLIWRKFGHMCVPEKYVQIFDEEFVRIIDNTDNTGEPNPLSSAIGGFNPVWLDESQEFTNEFNTAVEFATVVLNNAIRHMNASAAAEALITDYIAISPSEHILVINKYAPFMNTLLQTEYKFVIYPSLRGGWNIQGIPLNKDTQELRVSFPIEWRGLKKEDLPLVSGIKTLNFCHAGNFLASTETKEDAIRVAEVLLNENYE